MSAEPDGAPEERDREREPERPRPASRYSIWVGAAFLVVIAVATVNMFQTDNGAPLGADEAEAGGALPEFALPRLPGGPDGDANVFQDDCETSENPCPAEERRTPACRVELERVIRICDLFDRPLVLSFWFTTPADCPPTQDVVDAAARRHAGEVNFLAVAVRGDREEIEQVIRERGWRMPVGWDRDGAVSNLYRVGVCPTVAFVLPGGILGDAAIGTEALSGPELERAIDDLVREAHDREAAGR
jgi:hypothetical protein